ncbi:protein dj-1 homolog c [Phtheirospermum japonicum]|uniref:Protein dj-1 homolog c n=1 Tax=Phtheirospermum japonicum TaxID=374723 RepID=A0A830BT96_9LAMI|nr:protein dj-1 homolog c [Phtheirospermum japonicum]
MKLVMSLSTLLPVPASNTQLAIFNSSTFSICAATQNLTIRFWCQLGSVQKKWKPVIMIDVLRRAGAYVTVASVEEQLEVEASGGTRLVADEFISDCSDQTFDLVALPGGMPGSARLRESQNSREHHEKTGRGEKLLNLADDDSRKEEFDEVSWSLDHAPQVSRSSCQMVLKKIELVTIVDDSTTSQKQMSQLLRVLVPIGFGTEEMEASDNDRCFTTSRCTTCHPAFMDKLPTFWAVKSNLQVSDELTTSRGPGTSFQFSVSLVEQLFGESVAKEVCDVMLLNLADDDSRKEEFDEVSWSLDHAPQVLVPVANGSEEIELVTIVDILRRAKANVTVASVGKSLQILASSGTKIIADKMISDIADSVYDLIILPEKRATAHPSVISMLDNMVNGTRVVIDGKLVTGKGLSTTADFALAIVSKIFGQARARSVAEGLVFEYPK